MKLIIDYPDDMDPIDAVCRIYPVLRDGRVSEAAGIHHFCWATVFQDGVVVQTLRKRRPEAADSLRVYRQP